MPIDIHISAHPDHGDLSHQIEEAMAAVGFVRNSARQIVDRTTIASVPASKDPIVDESGAVDGAADKPQRERGQPAPGRKRRTKEEIAEDEAADKADAEASAVHEEKPQISTGEERVGPEDDAETVAQDTADEKAESDAAKAAREPDKKLTLDDVRNALGGYVKKFGMAAVQEDGPKVISLVLKDDAKVKVSDIPDDQATIQRVIDGVNEMIAKNPFQRDKVA